MSPTSSPPEPGGALATTTLTLDRAHFAGCGVRGTDVGVGAREGIGLCDVSVERNGETALPTRVRRLVLDRRDGDGGPEVPPRVGLYDAPGRAPLPSDGALSSQRLTDEIRLLRVDAETSGPRALFYKIWESQELSVFEGVSTSHSIPRWFARLQQTSRAVRGRNRAPDRDVVGCQRRDARPRQAVAGCGRFSLLVAAWAHGLAPTIARHLHLND